MNLQGHTETPTHHKDTPQHQPSVHRPQKPQHPHHQPATKAQRDHGSSQKQKEGKSQPGRKPAHKSSPETERTLPIGGGVRVRIPSLGALPMSYRKD